MWYIIAAICLMVVGAFVIIPRNLAKVAAKDLFSTAKVAKRQVEIDEHGNEFVQIKATGKLSLEQATLGQLVGYRGKKGRIHIGKVERKSLTKNRVVIALDSRHSLRGKGSKLLAIAA